jgi:phosphoinositide-3-kinase regulatory subunit 4
LENIEKRWIAYQLLTGLRQCHSLKVYHGDIKSENVMATSWNWVYLSDFAPFKPVFLPENDPSQFSFFFDTSQRRSCYVAPERFLASGSSVEGRLTEAMDIFSLGCVIAELFLDGAPLFTLAQLFKFKKGEYTPPVRLIKDAAVQVCDAID